MLQRIRYMLRVCPAALCLLFTLCADPGASDDPAAPRHLDRSLLSESFRNTGTQGALAQGGSIGRFSQSMTYPRVFTGTFVGATPQSVLGGGRLVGGLDDRDNSKGEGVWILAKDAGGNLYSTSSGPWSISQDIVEGRPDLGASLKLSSGEDHPFVKARLGFETKDANVWFNSDSGNPQNTAPLTPEPVEISNYRENGGYTHSGFDHFPEEIVISQWHSDESIGFGTGMSMTRHAYGWSHPDFDDFFIVELVVENTSSRDYEEVYLAYMNYFSLNKAGHNYRVYYAWWDLWGSGGLEDDRYQYTEASNYAGPYRGRKISYQYDEDAPETPEDDRGNAMIGTLLGFSGLNHLAEGELFSPQYIGWGPVDVVPPYINDPEVYVAPGGASVGGPDIPIDQPRYSHWWKRRSGNPEFEPNETTDTVEEIWAKFITPGQSTDDNPTDGGPRPEERSMQEQVHSQVYGPYRLRRGEKAKVVLIFAAGVGSEYAGPGGEPMDFRFWSISPRARGEIDMGEQALFEHVDRGRLLYRMGYDLPNPPPDVPSIGRSETGRPLLVKSNADGKLVLTWTDGAENAVHPDYTGAEASDVIGYRIYHTNSLTKAEPAEHTGDESGPMKLLAEISAKDPTHYSNGLYSFVDDRSVAGFGYWYAITTYTRGHDSWTNANAQNNVIPGAQMPMVVSLPDLPARVQKHIQVGQEANRFVDGAKHAVPNQHQPALPAVVASEGADRLERKVVVVPNPWKDDGVHSYGRSGENNKRMRFINLPRLARVSVFTAAGDLVVELVHDGTLDPSQPDVAELSWTNQDIRTGIGQPSPGIYYFAVESLVPGNQGKVQTGMFAIIQ